MEQNIVQSDLEIAQSAKPRPILEVGNELGLTSDDLELFGPLKAKLSYTALKRILNDESKPNGK